MMSTRQNAYSHPGTKPQRAPARAPNTMTSNMMTKGGRSVKVKPANAAKNAPRYSCPSAPMLKKPALNDTMVAAEITASGMKVAMTFEMPYDSLHPVVNRAT